MPDEVVGGGPATIERIELYELEAHEATMRVFVSTSGARRHAWVRWADGAPWAALCVGAAWFAGRAVDLRDEVAADEILRLVQSATEAGVDARQAEALARALMAVRAGWFEASSQVPPPLAETLRLEVFTAAADASRPASAREVTVERAQAIRCNRGRRAEGSVYEFVLQLDVRDEAGAAERAVVTWSADAGWERLAAAAGGIHGFRLRAWQGRSEEAALEVAAHMLNAGLTGPILPALTVELRAALEGLETGERHQPLLPYADMLPRVSRYTCYPPAPLPTWRGKPLNVFEGVTYMHPLGGDGTKGHLLERQALAFGLETVRFSKGSFVAFDRQGRSVNFRWSRSPISSAVALGLCTHKDGTRACLARHGVPVPEGRMFANGDFEAAVRFASDIGYPVVCKPAAGVRGIGVVANIADEAQLRDAFRLFSASQLGDDDFIVEKHVKGSDYRIIVIDGEVVAAILREPASVVGDGRSNVAELIMLKNVVRRMNPHLWPRPVMYGEAMRYRLTRAGLSLASVPAAGQLVYLTNTASLSQGGDSIDVLDEMHPSIKASAVAAVLAVPGMRYCGVDYLIEDHTRPIDAQEAGICELNAHAALGNCEYPMFGTPREVARVFFLKAAEVRGLEVAAEPAARLCLRLDVRGKVTGVGFRRWLQRYAERFGVTGTVRNVGQRRLEAIVCGPTDPVTAMAAAVVLGPRRAMPTSVRTTQLPLRDFEGFEILQDDLPDDLADGASDAPPDGPAEDRP